MTASKTELIESVTTQTRLPKKDVAAVVNALLGDVRNRVQRGEAVRLNGVGTVELTDSKPRNVRSLTTHEVVQIPARKRVTFKVSSSLKSSLRAS